MPALVAVLSLGLYAAALWIEFSVGTRYSALAMGSVHIWTGVFAVVLFIAAAGLVHRWGCVLAALVAAALGLGLEQQLHQGKSSGLVIVIGCLMLLIPGAILSSILRKRLRL